MKNVKYLCGFSYTLNIANFEAFRWTISLRANLLFLKSVEVLWYLVQELSKKIKYVPKIDWNLKLTWLWYKCEGFFFQHYYFLSFNSKRHFISEVVGTKNKIGILKYSYWKRIRGKHFWYLKAEKSDNTKMDIRIQQKVTYT